MWRWLKWPWGGGAVRLLDADPGAAALRVVIEPPIAPAITPPRAPLLIHTGNTELDPVTGREIPKQSEQG